MAVMTGQLSTIVRDLFERLDALDLDACLALFADDAQGVDELSRRWLRGRAELEGYFAQMAAVVRNVRSELTDLHEATYGDAGVVSGWLEQEYTIDGRREHVSAPTTVVLRRSGAEWRIALLHTVPLAPAE